MTLKRTQEPLTEPITVAEAKTHLGVTTSDHDTYIQTLVKVARATCEARIQRTLVTSTWKLTLDAFPDDIELLMPPIQSVQSLQYIDADGATQQLTEDVDFSLDATSEPGWIVLAHDVTDWPETHDQINAVEVVYIAGYGGADAVPEPLKQWIKLAVGELFEHRERSADDRVVPHQFVDGLLDYYRVPKL